MIICSERQEDLELAKVFALVPVNSPRGESDPGFGVHIPIREDIPTDGKLEPEMSAILPEFKYPVDLDALGTLRSVTAWLGGLCAHHSTLRTPRLRRPRPQEMKAEQLEIYKRVRYGVNGKGTQLFRLVGEDESLKCPFGAWLLSPSIGADHERFGDTMRFGCTIASRWREVAIFAVGTFSKSSYERYAHEAVALHVGLAECEVFGVRLGIFADVEGESETFVAEFARNPVEHRGEVGDSLFEDVVVRLGGTALFEIAALVGYYSLLSRELELFRVAVPAEAHGV